MRAVPELARVERLTDAHAFAPAFLLLAPGRRVLPALPPLTLARRRLGIAALGLHASREGGLALTLEPLARRARISLGRLALTPEPRDIGADCRRLRLQLLLLLRRGSSRHALAARGAPPLLRRLRACGLVPTPRYGSADELIDDVAYGRVSVGSRQGAHNLGALCLPPRAAQPQYWYRVRHTQQPSHARGGVAV
jgi:hypothetical protein